MALKVNPKTQLVFFETVLSGHPVVVAEVEKLMTEKGVEFSTEFYTVKAKIGDKFYTQTLTANSSSLMKNSVEPFVMVQNRNLLIEWVGKLYSMAYGKKPPFSLPSDVAKDETPAPPTPTQHWVVLQSKGKDVIATIKALRTLFHCDLHTAKTFVDNVPCMLGNTFSSSVADHIVKVLAEVASVEAGALGFKSGSHYSDPEKFGKVFFTANDLMHNGGKLDTSDSFKSAVKDASLKLPKANPSGKAVPLAEATQVGQRVFGTTDGSYYHTIAVGKRMNVAAKIEGYGTNKSVSIRAAFPGGKGLATDITRLEDAGIGWKSTYGSMHFNTGDIPVARVIGAFVVGLDIPFDDQISSAADLVMNGGS